MSNIAATDITVTVLNKRRNNGLSRFNLQLVFGDGALTYPAGGVPISKAALGCPNEIQSLQIYDKGTSGYEWSYDRTNEKLVGLQSAVLGTHTHTVAHAHDLLVKGGQIASTTNDIAHYGTDILGKQAATDATIAKADTATKGGVLTETPTTSATSGAAAAALAQLSTVAIAAQTLRVEVVGW